MAHNSAIQCPQRRQSPSTYRLSSVFRLPSRVKTRNDGSVLSYQPKYEKKYENLTLDCVFLRINKISVYLSPVMGKDYRQIIEQSIDEQAELWLADAAKLSDVYHRLTVRALIAEWALVAKDCAGAAGAASVLSYSIGGRSVTKSDIINIQHRKEELERTILAELYGGGGVLSADLRGAF